MKTKEELKEWRCPTEMITESFCGKCDAEVGSYQMELAETYIHAKDEAGSMMLAHGIDPGFPHTEIRPVSYDITLTCKNGHEHFIERQYTNST